MDKLKLKHIFVIALLFFASFWIGVFATLYKVNETLRIMDIKLGF